MAQPNRLSGEDLLKLVEGALADSLAESAEEFEGFEDELMSVLMELGRGVVRTVLERRCREETVEDGWRVAVRSNKALATSFGEVKVERPLYRQERNGPTRCRLSETVGVIRGMWTPRAARVVAVTLAELTLGRSEELLAEIGGLTPSAASIRRLGIHLSDAWEARRAEFEDVVARQTPIPPEAATVAISLDGVMVNVVGANRAEQKAAAKAKEGCGKGSAGYKEASVGLVTFYSAAGERLLTRRVGRMPEPGKQSTKAWLVRELDTVRERRSDLVVVAIADGAPNNWSFLRETEADHEVVDYYHAAEHVHRLVQRCSARPNALKTQATCARLKLALLEEREAAPRVFAELLNMRKKAGRAPRSKSPTYFELHADRMNYAELREKKLPIGSGVTEGTCRTLVVDRLRRSGMCWGQAGGQSVLTLRALRISGDFPLAWPLLKAAAQQAA